MPSQTLPDGTFYERGRRGEVYFRRLGPAVAYQRPVGDCTRELYVPVAALFDAVIAEAGRLTMFADCSGMTDYETAFRDCWLEWFKRHGEKVQCQLLSRSLLVSMGASVINLGVRRRAIVVYNDLEKFEATLRSHSSPAHAAR